MTKADIVEDIAQRTGLTKKEVGETVDLFLKKIGDLLVQGQHLEIRGFGTFKVKERKERMARNPRTGDAVPVPSRRCRSSRSPRCSRTGWPASEVRGPVRTCDRPAQRYRHPPDPGHVRGHGPGRGRRRRARRRPDRAAPAGRDGRLLGKADALYVPSGTMANQLALGAQTRPGQQVILEAGAHIYQYEGGAPGALWGLTTCLIQGDGGALPGRQIEAALPPGDVHFPEPGLVCLENTHNKAGGRILPQAAVVEIGDRGPRPRPAVPPRRRPALERARGHGPAARRALRAGRHGLGLLQQGAGRAGGLLPGRRRGDDRARPPPAQAPRRRHAAGGPAGRRLPACARAPSGRLAEDHAHARRLADELTNPLLSVGHPVETNIVVLDVAAPGTAAGLLAHLAAHGILALSLGPGRVRLIPNLHVDGRRTSTATLAALNSYPGD
jgi:threonine aldolase